ncbi:DedA family protein [Desulfuromonas carbonis]
MPSVDLVIPWIHHYGYGAIFGLLLLGIVGLPVPDEWLLLFAGYLVERQELQLLPTLLAAFAGASTGISVSYLLGRGPARLLVGRWGFLLHLDPERLDRVRAWFDRRGRWLLTFGFFLPGVRHLTAIVAGTSFMRWPEFALFAFAGAFFWTLLFVLAGYWLGEKWRWLAEGLQHHHLLLAMLSMAALLIWGAYRAWSARKQG